MPIPESTTFTHAGLTVTHYPAWSGLPEKFEVEQYKFDTREQATHFIDTKLTEENRVTCVHGGPGYEHYAPSEDSCYIEGLGVACHACIEDENAEARDMALQEEQWRADRLDAPIVDDLDEQLKINRQYSMDQPSEEQHYDE